MRSKDPELMNKIIEYVDSKYLIDKRVPTIREIANDLSISKSSVNNYLTEMEKRGLIERNGPFRSTKTASMNKVDTDSEYLPVIGTVACGTPLFAEQNIEYYLPIPTRILGSGKFFILKAKGDSMINAGIDSGDYVIVRKQENAETGQIVVALINDEATLKRFYLDEQRKQVRLHPENDKYEDMFFDDIVIQGVAVKIIKNLL